MPGSDFIDSQSTLIAVLFVQSIIRNGLLRFYVSRNLIGFNKFYHGNRDHVILRSNYEVAMWLLRMIPVEYFFKHAVMQCIVH